MLLSRTWATRQKMVTTTTKVATETWDSRFGPDASQKYVVFVRCHSLRLVFPGGVPGAHACSLRPAGRPMVPPTIRAVFQAWRIVTVTMLLEAVRSELGRLKEKLGKQAESIWRMKKDELVEVARRELGLTQAQAQGETVLVLRERIRSHRVENQHQQMMSTNPDAHLPKGLQRMTHPELAQECARRGIETPSGSSNRAQATRAQMIILIQDHVKAVQEGSVVEGDWADMEQEVEDL